jgi:YD repeat-containing protein
MKGATKGLALTLSLCAGLALGEDEMRDFYAEPGMNPFSTAAGQDSTENIDPFSGNVQLSYLDLAIPGNGGLDIEITRYYNLPQSAPGYANPHGYGWTMHFGRITIGSGHANLLCGTGSVPGGDTLDNPSIEMPDGGRELLSHSAALNDGTYITKSNWKAECIDPSDYTRGIVATAPNGTRYLMREYVFMQGEDGPSGEPAPTVETWLTNRIEDANGNSIDITYLAIASGMKLAVRLDSSDGRQVLFEYLDEQDAPVTAASRNARLGSISANGREWRYLYAPVDGSATGWGAVRHYQLLAVERPDGSEWRYAYGGELTSPDFNRLTQVTYPAGGVVNYQYQWVRPYLPNQDFRIVAISRKEQANPGHAAGTWRYEFHPGHSDFADLGIQPLPDNAGRMADLTRIVTPVGEEHIYHVGYWALVGTHDILWQMGLKIIHREFQPTEGGGLSLVRETGNSWNKRALSDEVYRGGILSALWDSKVYAPVLTRRTVTLDGHTYATDYADHDAFGNPGTLTEWAIYPSEGGNRITHRTYLNDTVGWFIGLPESESVTRDGTALGTVARGYDDFGRLQYEDRFGVLTQYTYTAQGDTETITDALGNTTRFGNYFRGQAGEELRPDGSRVIRVINATGTVAARTSGRGNTTGFTYDAMNRLTGIDYPRGQDVTIVWDTSAKTLTRGLYREVVNWDGFGRDVELVRTDLGSGESFSRHYAYDAVGRRTFESDVNSSAGIYREYDVADRPTRITYQDGSTRTVTHQGAHQERHRDENGNETDYLYQIYGAPENRFLSWVLAPEDVGTRISRDALGNIAAVFQGERDPANAAQYYGYTRTYTYNSRLQLTEIDSPADIGTTHFGRDILGNVTSRQRGNASPVSFRYDSMNRPIASDYPDDSIDATYSYDADGNLESSVNAFATRSYDYDANGNLTREEIAIGNKAYVIQYSVDDLDHLAAVAYPSGRSVDYTPDALGRPTRAAPYLDGVDYFPDGSVQRLLYTNGRVVNYTKTPRNWVGSIDIDTIAHLTYRYDPSGNVVAIDDSMDSTSNRSMSYDGLHRLTVAQGEWGSAGYGYDAFSNLVQKGDPAAGSRSQHYSYQGMLLDKITYSDSAAQRVFSHDDNGNVTFSDDALFDPFTGLPTEVLTRRQHFFDAACNMTYSLRSARNDLGEVVPLESGSFSSEYDADNGRVRKINHSDANRATDYAYSRSGLLLGEYEETGTRYGNEYFYLGQLQVATAKLNAPPSIETGGDLAALAGNVVPISASGDDHDGEIVSVEWRQLAGPGVEINDPQAYTTFFTAPAVLASEVITLQITAVDNLGGTASGTIDITIEPSAVPPSVERVVAIPGDGENILLWQPVADADRYRVYWTSDKTQPVANWQTEIVEGRYFSHTGLLNGDVQHYMVQAINDQGVGERSPVVSSTAGSPDWRAAIRIPDETTSLAPSSTRVASNRFGEATVLTEVSEAGSYRLYVRIFDLFSGWGDAELVNQSDLSHNFANIAIDDDGHVLAVWAEGPVGGRSLYSAYRPNGGTFRNAVTVEQYEANASVDGDIVGVSHLEFDSGSQAFICWRQNRLHRVGEQFDPTGATALVKRFDPTTGWLDEHNLEHPDHLGDTRHLSCDVSATGLMLAAWERHDSLVGGTGSAGTGAVETWLAAYDPSSGWIASETVGYLATGTREVASAETQNRQPRVAVSSAGYGIAVWQNEFDSNVEAIEYDHLSARWLSPEVVESRSNRIPTGYTHRVAANDSGDLLLAWGDSYLTRPAHVSQWERVAAFPALPLIDGLDRSGQPYSIHAEGTDLVANRLTAGNWLSQALGRPGDTLPKSPIYVSALHTNSLGVYWASGSALNLSSDQLPLSLAVNGDLPDTDPPITTLSATSSRSKGYTQYTITLQASESGETLFRLSGQVSLLSGGENSGHWQPYSGALLVQLDKKGTANIEFFSRDEAGNTETTQWEALQ